MKQIWTCYLSSKPHCDWRYSLLAKLGRDGNSSPAPPPPPPPPSTPEDKINPALDRVKKGFSTFWKTCLSQIGCHSSIKGNELTTSNCSQINFRKVLKFHRVCSNIKNVFGIRNHRGQNFSPPGIDMVKTNTRL